MNPKPNNKIMGTKGEDIAKNYLKKLGYEIQEQNYHTKFGEIDIICKDGDILVLVEVKFRTKNPLQDIEKTINKLKINRILKSAEIYIKETEVKFKEIRVDAFFIEKENGEQLLKLSHVKNFF